MNFEKYISEGGIYIKPNFLDVDEFNFIKNDIEKLNFVETYQPNSNYYGNRFQAYPCLEVQTDKYHKYFLPKFKKLLGREPIDTNCIVRKTLTHEIEKSNFNSQYGAVHIDTSVYASIFSFEQSYKGGTAFFEHHYEQVPDISIGAYSNRIIIYSGKRNHSSMHDFTFKERTIIAYAFD